MVSPHNHSTTGHRCLCGIELSKPPSRKIMDPQAQFAVGGFHNFILGTVAKFQIPRRFSRSVFCYF